MSIKSTRHLTREEALVRRDELEAELRGEVLTDEELGDLLDHYEIEVCRRAGRPCFTNYLVVNERDGS